jgi:hypothetical protein
MSAPATNPAELELMRQISKTMGDAIVSAFKASAIPTAFIAALVANESGGNPVASRFEAAAFADLALTFAGFKPAFGSIATQELETIMAGLAPAQVIMKLRNFTTSWGPTQIMGYQSIARHYPLSELTQISTHFKHTAELLAGFVAEWKLPIVTAMPRETLAALFRCWNTGRPDGFTTDPEYLSKGFSRMMIYQNL